MSGYPGHYEGLIMYIVQVGTEIKKRIQQENFKKPATSCAPLTWTKLVAEPKVCELEHRIILVEYNILRFEIPVHNMQMMTVGNSSDNLTEVVLGPFLANAVWHLVEVVKEITSSSQLQHQVQLALGGDHVIKTDHIRVTYQLHTLYLRKRGVVWEL